MNHSTLPYAIAAIGKAQAQEQEQQSQDNLSQKESSEDKKNELIHDSNQLLDEMINKAKEYIQKHDDENQDNLYLQLNELFSKVNLEMEKIKNLYFKNLNIEDDYNSIKMILNKLDKKVLYLTLYFLIKDNLQLNGTQFLFTFGLTGLFYMNFITILANDNCTLFKSK